MRASRGSSIAPSSVSIRPANIFSGVDLPAPLRPTSPTWARHGIDAAAPSSTTWPPSRAVTAFTVSIYGPDSKLPGSRLRFLSISPRRHGGHGEVIVIPAKAGIQDYRTSLALGPRFRGDDERESPCPPCLRGVVTVSSGGIDMANLDGANLDGKVVLITGTAGGQGRAAALAFARAGAKVLGCDVKADEAEETVALVTRAGGEMRSLHPLDASDFDSAKRWAKTAQEAWGGIDVLYNNAGSLRAKGAFSDSTIEEWDINTLYILSLPSCATM